MNFPHLDLPDNGDFKVIISCHYKLAVALHSLKTNPLPTPVKIGVSKRVCWLCEKYLKKLSAYYKVLLHISEYQGKCHAGWRLPPGTPSQVEKDMRLLLDAQMNEIREAVFRQKRLDSFLEDRTEYLEKEEILHSTEYGLDDDAIMD